MFYGQLLSDLLDDLVALLHLGLKLLNLLVENAEWKDCLITIPSSIYSSDAITGGKLWLLPGNLETMKIAGMVKNSTIRRRLNEVPSAFDYVIIDTAPTPSLFQEAIAIASDYLILPTDCEGFSALEGLPDTIAHTENVRAAAAARGAVLAEIIGIIPNKYREKTALHKAMITQLKQQYGSLVWKPIHQAVIFAEVQMHRQMLYALAPDARATQQMWEMVDRIESIGVKG